MKLKSEFPKMCGTLGKNFFYEDVVPFWNCTCDKLDKNQSV